MLVSASIQELATTKPEVFAFRITQKVTKDDMSAMAARMNAVFETQDKVSMLLIFATNEGAEAEARFDWDTLKSQVRAISKVKKHAAVGAPEAAANKIVTMGSLLPVDARAFPLDAAHDAWDFVGASPAAA